jgi:hypothetical protein
MKNLVLLAVPTLVVGCAFQLRARAPEPVVTAEVVAAPPAPSPPPAPEAPAAPAVEVEVEAVPTGDPEEVSATSEPPDPVYEEQVDAPGSGYVWVRGYWGWNGLDWGWHWGHWEVAPEGRVYVEPYYERVGDRVVYVHGYWGARDAPRRSYGGERIRFAKAERPANYHRGERVAVEHRAGPPPGRRPGGTYERATGPARPIPHETAPHRVVAEQRAVSAPAEPRTEAKAETRSEAKTETRNESKTEKRSEPHSEEVPGRAPPPGNAHPTAAHGATMNAEGEAKAEKPAQHPPPPANAHPAPKKTEKKK